ncbi:MAG: glycerophosphoryl diester phosphodiesterase [Cellvibrionaceae bacterium]|jgi:glycerophosphoryl diester phosphodiesterase
MSKKLFLPTLLILLFTASCSVFSPSPSLTDPTDSAGFSYRGMGGLPNGFDAQGHRGARGLLPENTLPAFEAALDLGVTTLELDLHYTQDGELVIWHDPVIGKDKCRLPDGAKVGEEVPDPKNPLRKILISQQPLAVLENYQCDLNPDANAFPKQQVLDMPLAGTDYGIATLDELFDFVAAYAQSAEKTDLQKANAAVVEFNIETKRKVDHPEYIDDGFTGGEAGPFELAILEIIAKYGFEHRVVIQSFDHRSLQVIREIDSDIRLAALTTGGEAKVKVYNGYKFDIWSPRARDLTPELLEEAQGLGLKVIPWTVNDVAEMERLIEMGVDGLISDRPDLLLQN